MAVERFHRKKIHGDQNQIPSEQYRKEIFRKPADERAKIDGSDKSDAPKKKLGENAAPNDCQSLRARDAANPLATPSYCVHPNSHNIGAGLQNTRRMTKFVGEYDGKNGQPGHRSEAKPADNDSQSQGGPMDQYRRYGA